MTETRYHITITIQSINPPDELRLLVLKRIAHEEKRAAKIRFAFLGSLSLVSFASIIPSYFYLGKGLAESGFFEYFSLLSTDQAMVLTYWKEISFSLIESLPLLAITALLAAVGIFIWSGTKAIRDAQTILLTT